MKLGTVSAPLDRLKPLFTVEQEEKDEVRMIN